MDGAEYEAILRGIAEQVEIDGEFVVSFPWPLGEAQEKLVRSLGVTPRFPPVPSTEELKRLLEANG